MSDFLPDDYQAPTSEGKYTRFEQGETKIRILSKPILGWEDWKDSKPHRFQMKNKPERPFDPSKQIKHFWAFIIWNYNVEQIQICQITQATIRTAIQNLTDDEDWGSPYEYDIKIIRTGQKLDTKYSITPSPKSDIISEIEKAYNDTPIRLEALFTGDDPFDVKQSV